MPRTAEETLSAILPFRDRHRSINPRMVFTIVGLPNGLNPQKGTNG
jgi:hypothetical protein